MSKQEHAKPFNATANESNDNDAGVLAETTKNSTHPLGPNLCFQVSGKASTLQNC